MKALKNNNGQYISWKRFGGILITVIFFLLSGYIASTATWRSEVNAEVKQLVKTKVEKTDYQRDREEMRGEIEKIQDKLETVNTNLLLIVGERGRKFK